MATEIAYGMHAMQAILKNRRDDILELYVLKGRHDKRLQQLLNRCKGVSYSSKSRAELNQIAGSEQHQGVVAILSQNNQTSNNLIAEPFLSTFIESITNTALILILDGVTDPHNLGACLRSAEAAGVDLVITPKDKSVGLTPVVRKVACGAAEVVPICQVTNLARAIEQVQDSGIWVAGAAGEAEQTLYDIDFTGPMAIVLGAEGEGMRRLTREKCDYLMQIPMRGTVSSLNVSVAAGICLFEARRQQLKIG